MGPRPISTERDQFLTEGVHDHHSSRDDGGSLRLCFVSRSPPPLSPDACSRSVPSPSVSNAFVSVLATLPIAYPPILLVPPPNIRSMTTYEPEVARVQLKSTVFAQEQKGLGREDLPRYGEAAASGRRPISDRFRLRAYMTTTGHESPSHSSPLLKPIPPFIPFGLILQSMYQPKFCQ